MSRKAARRGAFEFMAGKERKNEIVTVCHVGIKKLRNIHKIIKVEIPPLLIGNFKKQKFKNSKKEHKKTGVSWFR